MSELSVGTLAEDRIRTGPIDDRRELLSRVHRSGLDHVFVADHISFFTGMGMDGLIQAATIGALEPNLRIHIGVYLLALRHPLPVARQIASLCESAPGRLVLGVGVGGEDRHEIEICGVDPKTRGRRTNETLVALRGLLTGEPTSHRCEFFEFEDALIRPAPDPAVPVVIGGRSDAAIRRAALYADGWLGVWCSPKRFARAVEEISTIAAKHRDHANPNRPWIHGLQVWVGIDHDRALARERLASRMETICTRHPTPASSLTAPSERHTRSRTHSSPTSRRVADISTSCPSRLRPKPRSKALRGLRNDFVHSGSSTHSALRRVKDDRSIGSLIQPGRRDLLLRPEWLVDDVIPSLKQEE